MASRFTGLRREERARKARKEEEEKKEELKAAASTARVKSEEWFMARRESNRGEDIVRVPAYISFFLPFKSLRAYQLSEVKNNNFCEDNTCHVKQNHEERRVDETEALGGASMKTDSKTRDVEGGVVHGGHDHRRIGRIGRISSGSPRTVPLTLSQDRYVRARRGRG